MNIDLQYFRTIIEFHNSDGTLIRRISSEHKARWQFFNDDDQWEPYPREVSESIEKHYDNL